MSALCDGLVTQLCQNMGESSLKSISIALFSIRQNANVNAFAAAAAAAADTTTWIDWFLLKHQLPPWKALEEGRSPLCAFIGMQNRNF